MSNRLLWLVLRVQAQKEFHAERLIRDHGHQALVPYEQKWKRTGRARRPKLWRYPYFTRYVFAAFRDPVDWTLVERGTDPEDRIIKGPIGFGGKPALLNSAEVAYWERQCATEDASGGSNRHKGF